MTTKAQIRNAAVALLLGPGRKRKLDLDDLYDAAYNIDADIAKLFSATIRISILGDPKEAEDKLALTDDMIVTRYPYGNFTAKVAAEHKKLRAQH